MINVTDVMSIDRFNFVTIYLQKYVNRSTIIRYFMKNITTKSRKNHILYRIQGS